MKYQITRNAVPMFFAALLLSACSGQKSTLSQENNFSSGSSNGTDTGSSTDARYKSCKGSSCLQSEYTIEPIKNLNYSCSNVYDVTGINSVITCPADNNIEVFLQKPGGKRKVALGSVPLNTLPKFVANQVNEKTILSRNTPLDFVDNPDKRIVTQAVLTKFAKGERNVSDPAIKRLLQAVNMIRFLDAFRDVPFNDNAPINQMEIKDAYKNNMDEKLSADVVLEDFASDAFISKTKPWLDSHKKTVSLSQEKALERLIKALKVVRAGVYYQTPLFSQINVGTGQFGAFQSGISISGEKGDSVVSMAMYTMANREGATTGQGMHWQGTPLTQLEKFNLFRAAEFSKMRIEKPSDATIGLLSNALDNQQWALFDKSNEKKAIIAFNKGKLNREFAIIGTSELYKTALGKDVENTDDLGAWTQNATQSGVDGISGQATIFKNPSSNLSTFFDPSVWLSKNTVAVGKHYVFPLYATLNFTYGKALSDANSSCQQNGCRFKDSNGNDVSKLGITILENGDIITDASSSLSAPNCEPVSLVDGFYKDAKGNVETRIGTIRATATSAGGKDGAFINPTIILTGEKFGPLDGIHIGSRVSTALININVAGVKQAVTSFDNGNTNSSNGTLAINQLAFDSNTKSFNLADAKWTNPYNLYTKLHVAYRESLNSEFDEKAFEDQLGQQSGDVSIEVSDCYKIKPRAS